MGFDDDDDDDDDDRKAIIEALVSGLVGAWVSSDASYAYKINYLGERVLSGNCKKAFVISTLR